MTSKRILITGLATYWGGRLAQRLEEDPSVEVIIGVDTREPTVELERTEFVKIGMQHSLIRRIVGAAEVDTVVDTRLVVDSAWMSPRAAHENNAIGTMNIVTACSGPDSPVRKFVFKSSAHYYGCEQDDPSFFTEEMERPHAPRTPIERDILEAERTVAQFADTHADVLVSVLRFANGLGGSLRTSHHRHFSLPAILGILGFDPRYQFIHEDDLVGVLDFAVRHDLDGVYNGAADGVLALSEVADLLGKPFLPVLPPWGTGLAGGALNRAGVRIPVEMLRQLRFGRGLDNRRLKAAGYVYEATSREAVIRLAEHARTRALTRESEQPYRYEREVEEFLRWSPSVRHSGPRAGKVFRPSPSQVADLSKALASFSRAPGDSPADEPRPVVGGPDPEATEHQSPLGAPPPDLATPYDDLDTEAVLRLLGSLEAADLEALGRHEAEHRGRPPVLAEIERLLAQRRSAADPSSTG